MDLLGVGIIPLMVCPIPYCNPCMSLIRLGKLSQHQFLGIPCQIGFIKKDNKENGHIILLHHIGFGCSFFVGILIIYVVVVGGGSVIAGMIANLLFVSFALCLTRGLKDVLDVKIVIILKVN